MYLTVRIFERDTLKSKLYYVYRHNKSNAPIVYFAVCYYFSVLSSAYGECHHSSLHQYVNKCFIIIYIVLTYRQ